MNKREGVFPVELDKFDLDLMRLRTPKVIAVDKMARSLKNRGQLTPVIVVANRSRFLLVDGFKRYRAAMKIGLARLGAVLIEADSKQAKAMLYLLNRSGGFTMIQEALLVRELIELDGLTQSEAGILLDRHKSWVSRRLSMIRRLSPEIIESLLLETLPPGVGPSLARIPPCNQPDFTAAVQIHGLAPNEIRRLADLYCKATDAGVKRAILQSPRQALSIVKKGIQTGTVNWPGKIRILYRIIDMLGKDLIENRKKIPRARMEKFRNHLDRLKPILTGMLELIEKEEAWDD